MTVIALRGVSCRRGETVAIMGPSGCGKTTLSIPWLQILAIGGFAFVASLLMTIIPSRQAASIHRRGAAL